MGKMRNTYERNAIRPIRARATTGNIRKLVRGYYRVIDKTQMFPLFIIIVNTCASVPYAFAGDWRKALYWLFAAGLTVVVTF